MDEYAVDCLLAALFSLQLKAEVFSYWPERHFPDRCYVNTRPPIRARSRRDVTQFSNAVAILVLRYFFKACSWELV